MRVVCISDKDQYLDGEPSVIKGNVYTIAEENYREESSDDFSTWPAGVYYSFIETGDNVEYHSSAFLKINEDQQDETEFERSELVKEMKS